MATLKSPGVDVIVRHQCVSKVTPDNIHSRFVSKMRGILIYRVFRGKQPFKRWISPWKEDEMDAGYFYCPYVPLMMSNHGNVCINNTWYGKLNIHEVWAHEMRSLVRKLVPFYPRPGVGVTFKTRYDK